MNFREYLWFVVLGFLAFLVGGFINQALGLSESQNLLMQVVAFLIPMTIFFYIYHRLRRR